MTQNSRLILVGAGPGDPELITLKGINALKTADLVLYDALINPVLLNYCQPSCIKRYVGKRAGKHGCSQQEICATIRRSSQRYRNIVRLKGGDPFIFGRATEEMETARSLGMTVEVIQGISSALAVPAAAMIPLTSRDISQSFWVITGTTRSGKFADDLYLAAQSAATVVLLMAMHRLQQIMNIFLRYGRGETPVAIIQEGCTPQQKVITGQVSSITALAKEKGLSNPAVIVVGAVVLSQLQITAIMENKEVIQKSLSIN